MNSREQIKVEYGVIIPTWPDATVVVKPEGEDRLLVFVGRAVNCDTVRPTVLIEPEPSESQDEP